ncbi:HAD family hydrolase [Clostridium sp. YIM B02505]|uniref:HAD family hydrolase n=1 Tax=Clostridium yunnanense TaxID=2800325 RepID=A0ABS1EV85_9CLOT|nr:HAD family hydrolase [Clostridium yunnanense]MBK1813292.1 HAD family hydrolase [Clostridium yunnanense]
MYSTVIFDIDGTILDTEFAVLSSLQKLVYEETDKKLSFEDLLFSFGITGEAALSQLGIKDPKEGCNKWNEYLKDYFHHIKVFDDMEETLAKLHEMNISIGIVTSKTKLEYEADFMPFGLSNFFDIVVCADDTEKHKPDPDPILKFIELSGSDASKTLYIGDTIYDFRCAQDSHIDFALASWGCKSKDGINATYILKNPKDLLEIVNAV